MTVIGIEEAAVLMHMSQENLRRLAKAGKVPCAKPGKRWIFLVEDLHAYIRSHYRSQNQNDLAPIASALEKRKCHYTDAITSGLSISQAQTAKEYAARLKLL